MNLVKRIDIANFRGFKDTSITLGRYLTVIFGKNGCLKSTLLGMIAQPLYFSSGKNTVYTTDYKDKSTGEYSFAKQINGEKFETKYSDIFRMSESDILAHGVQKYEYFVSIEGKHVSFEGKLSGKDGVLRVSSQYSKETVTRRRFRLVGGSSAHKRGTGNFPHPVIFLGLNRLFPMALSTLNEKIKIELTKEEKQWFEDSYGNILSTDVQDEKVSVSFPINAKKHPYLLPSCTDCNYKSVSAGQDNVGQIVSAILSFKRMKKELGDGYRGGLLLIDELEASLHPISQKNLMEFLANHSVELGIQIVATSHSSLILEAAFRSGLAKYITPVHVKKESFSSSCVIDMPNADKGYSKIKNDLFEEFDEVLPKLSVVVEDNVAYNFLKAILGKKIMSNIYFPQKKSKFESSSCDFLIKLASYDFLNRANPCLYIVDADQAAQVQAMHIKNLLCFFGKSAPEKELYEYFSRKDAWINTSFEFDASVCFSGFRMSNYRANPSKFGSEIGFYKKWFAKMANPKGFGLGCAKAIRAYCHFHAKEVLDFRLEFCKAALSVLPPNEKSKYALLVDFFKREYNILMGSQSALKLQKVKKNSNPSTQTAEKQTVIKSPSSKKNLKVKTQDNKQIEKQLELSL